MSTLDYVELANPFQARDAPILHQNWTVLGQCLATLQQDPHFPPPGPTRECPLTRLLHSHFALPGFAMFVASVASLPAQIAEGVALLRFATHPSEGLEAPGRAPSPAPVSAPAPRPVTPPPPRPPPPARLSMHIPAVLVPDTLSVMTELPVPATAAAAYSAALVPRASCLAPSLPEPLAATDIAPDSGLAALLHAQLAQWRNHRAAVQEQQQAFLGMLQAHDERLAAAEAEASALRLSLADAQHAAAREQEQHAAEIRDLVARLEAQSPEQRAWRARLAGARGMGVFI